MLIEFKVKNFKSFSKETVFSMSAAPKQSGLDHSLLKPKIKTKTIKVLCSSVIYGPNASGKSNIIGAMDVLRAIVLRGNIKNSDEKSSLNVASSLLELIPNKNLDKATPVKFSIDFFEENLFIHYTLGIDLGTFLDRDYSRKILFEELAVNGEMIFTREEKLNFGHFSGISGYMNDAYKQNADSVIDISHGSLNQIELFLTNGFKVLFSDKLVKLILDWFTDKFMVIYRADSLPLIQRYTGPKKNAALYAEKITNEAAKIFGVNSNAVGYIEEDNEVELLSLIKTKKGKKGSCITSRNL